MILKVYDPKKGKEITAGTIQGKRFIKKVTSRHYMRKYNGYGIDKHVLDKLYALNISKIIIKTKLHEYESDILNWRFNGILNNFGHGIQYFLPISFMTIK